MEGSDAFECRGLQGGEDSGDASSMSNHRHMAGVLTRARVYKLCWLQGFLESLSNFSRCEALKVKRIVSFISGRIARLLKVHSSDK